MPFVLHRRQVSFTSEFVENPPLLVPSWGGAGNGCAECTEFSSEFPRNAGAYVNVSSEGMIGQWEEQAVLQASDRRSGDRFGSTLALDQVNHNIQRTSRYRERRFIYCSILVVLFVVLAVLLNEHQLECME